MPSGIIQAAPDDSWSMYDLSAWAQQHPPAHPDAEDFAPDGSWYGMTQANGKLYTANPNSGQMIELTAQIREVADLSSTSQEWVGPTGITCHDGNFYLVTLGGFPAAQGAQNVLKITPAGAVSVYATGLTAAVSLTFDSAGNLYALETFTGSARPTPSADGASARLPPGRNTRPGDVGGGWVHRVHLPEHR